MRITAQHMVIATGMRLTARLPTKPNPVPARGSLCQVEGRKCDWEFRPGPRAWGLGGQILGPTIEPARGAPLA